MTSLTGEEAETRTLNMYVSIFLDMDSTRSQILLLLRPCSTEGPLPLKCRRGYLPLKQAGWRSAEVADIRDVSPWPPKHYRFVHHYYSLRSCIIYNSRFLTTMGAPPGNEKLVWLAKTYSSRNQGLDTSAKLVITPATTL